MIYLTWKRKICLFPLPHQATIKRGKDLQLELVRSSLGMGQTSLARLPPSKTKAFKLDQGPKMRLSAALRGREARYSLFWQTANSFFFF